MAHPVTWAALAGIAVILGVAGPFETDEVLRFVPRVVYWAVIVTASYSCGFLASDLVRGLAGKLPVWVRILVAGLLTGACVAAVVIVVNLAAFGFLPNRADLPEFLGSILAISLVITAVGEAIGQNATSTVKQANPPRLLQRIPLDKRGALIALSVEDHYVRIQTTKGTELVLLRLSDAINEVGDTVGTQVHRSHWAASDQVDRARREGDRAILTMRNGAEIPVSRANVSKIKEAGLLPR